MSKGEEENVPWLVGAFWPQVEVLIRYNHRAQAMDLYSARNNRIVIAAEWSIVVAMAVVALHLTRGMVYSRSHGSCRWEGAEYMRCRQET